MSHPPGGDSQTQRTASTPSWLRPCSAWPDSAAAVPGAVDGLVLLWVEVTQRGGPEFAVVVLDPHAVVRGDEFAATVAVPLRSQLLRHARDGSREHLRRQPHNATHRGGVPLTPGPALIQVRDSLSLFVQIATPTAFLLAREGGSAGCRG